MASAIVWLVLLAMAVAVGRFTVPGHGLSYAGSYEAFAHVIVGLLIAAAWLRRDLRWYALVLLFAITAVEGVMFITR